MQPQMAVFPALFTLLFLGVAAFVVLLVLVRLTRRHGGAAIALLVVGSLMAGVLLFATVGLYSYRSAPRSAMVMPPAAPRSFMETPPPELQPEGPSGRRPAAPRSLMVMPPDVPLPSRMVVDAPAAPAVASQAASADVTIVARETLQPPAIPAQANGEQTLSAPVEAFPSAPAPRPEWVDAALGKGNNVFRTKVEVGPYSTREECDRELPLELQRATATYVDRLLGAGASQRVTVPLTYLHERVFRGEWLEPTYIEVSGIRHAMFKLHALLEFDSQANQDLENLHHQALVAQRLGYTGGGMGLMLGLLATVFGYLKIDTATRGYYTRRLQALAGVAILAEATLVALLVRGDLGL